MRPTLPRRLALLSALSLSPLAALPLAGQEPPSTAPAAPAANPALDNPNTSPPGETANAGTGDWGGLRTRLQKDGLTLGGLIQVDVTKVLKGGANTAGYPTRDLIDLNATLDTEPLLHWPGGKVFIDLQSHQGPNGSAYVGDVQGFDSIDAPHFLQLSQLWYQQSLPHDTLRLKIGKIDSNADFSVMEHGNEFLQTAAGYAATIFPINSYPDPGPGAELFLSPSSIFYIGVGGFYSNTHQMALVFLGHPQSVERTPYGSFLITEAGSHWKIPAPTPLPGHAGIGAWYHTGNFPTIDNPALRATGAGGPYLFADQTLWTHDNGPTHPAQDLGLFFTAGYANPSTSPIDQNIAAGISGTGLLPARPDDVAGFLTSYAHLPEQPNLLHPEEIAFEAFYKYRLTPWASLKPDLQYIVSPSGLHPNATVFTLRFQIDF